jgi:hypothetical protein
MPLHFTLCAHNCFDKIERCLDRPKPFDTISILSQLPLKQIREERNYILKQLVTLWLYRHTTIFVDIEL